MSLQNISDMRLQRVRPSGMVSVVIGEVPAALKSPLVIELKPGSQPQFLDWRPVVGLWVAFFNKAEDWAVMDRAVEAAEKAGAKLLGFAYRNAAYTLATFQNKDDEAKATGLLRREMEALCK